MRKIWKKIKGKDKSGEYSPKSGSTRGSVASLNVSYEVKEKDLGKLHKAAWTGDLNKVKQLAKKDPNPLDKVKRTPLHLACIQGYRDIVQELLEWKAKANVGDNQARTPLMRAVEFQKEDCVKLLLEFGVDVDCADSQGLTSLHLAVGNGHINVIKMLLKANATLDTRDQAGYAPLHLAVLNKDEDACALLLREKADINVKDANAKTPLILACQEGSISLVKMLLEFNADVTYKDTKGWSADDYAVIQGHHACSQLITDHILKRHTPVSTPRSLSQPGSSLTTPRDQGGSIGLPVADGGGEDSDNETISKASGAPGSDWADSPDVSTGEDFQKGKDGSDLEENVFDDEKSVVPKISLAKFASNIHISESDTDGESVANSTPRRKISVVGNPMEEFQIVQSGKPGLSQQTSQNENSWGDSPVTPRRNNSVKGVSFKKDEELSEIHDITATESEGEGDFYNKAVKVDTRGFASSTPAKSDQGLFDSGYTPTGATTTVSSSLDKMKGNNKSAFMEDLGISDVDDLSEVSEGAGPPPPLPVSPPPTATKPQQKHFDDWDSSVSTPRPGILKNRSNSALDESGQSLPAKTQPMVNRNVESDDDSSGWDSTETAPSKPEIKPTFLIANTKESISEWDSDMEDMVNPEVSAFNQAAAFPVANTYHSKVTAEDVFKDDIFNPQQSITKTLYQDFETVKAASTEKEVVQSIDEKKEDEDSTTSSEWDSEADELPSVDENQQESPTAHSSPAPEKQKQEVTKSVDNEEESESISSWEVERKKKKQMQFWGKEKEDEFVYRGAGMDDLETMIHLEQEEQIQILRREEEAMLHKEREEEESRRLQKEEEKLRVNREEEELYRRQSEMEKEKARRDEEEEERIRREEEEEEERIRREEEEEEEERIRREEEEEEEERIRREEEEERIRREEERIRREEEEEEERIRREEEEEEERIRREEERIRREEEEEEERRQKEMEEDRIYRLKEEEEHNRKLKAEEEEKLAKQREEELSKRQKEMEAQRVEKERMRRKTEEEEMHRRQVDLQAEENNNIEWDKEEMERQAKLEEAWEMEEFNRQDSLRKAVNGNFDLHIQQDVSSTQLAADLELTKKQQVMTSELTSPPYKPVQLKQSKGVKPPGSVTLIASTSGTSTSAVDEIKQRLQVTSTTSSLTASQYHHGASDVYDDDESQLSDNPVDERPKLPVSYYHGMYRPHDPLDDDALSYTSTEVEDNTYSTVSYWKDREFFSNINLEEPTALLRLQEYVRDARRLFEQEKNQKIVLENKLKVSNNEKSEILKKLQNMNQEKAELEQSNLVLDQEIRSLQLKISNEQEHRKNAQALLSKTKEHLEKKETQFSSELEAKYSAEQEMRNLQNELRTCKNIIQELKKEKEDSERQIEHLTTARDTLKKINEDQQKLILQLQHTPRESSSLESSLDSTGRLDKHNPELYALQMELDQQRRRFKDEIAMLAGENEELAAKNEDLKNSLKLSEEALDQSVIQYNRQITIFEKESSSVHLMIDKERAAKDKLEVELESIKSRLQSANVEMEKAISARNEMERDHKRDKEVWSNEMERKDREIKESKDENQQLTQQLHNTEARLTTLEHELHASNTSLTERSSQYQLLKQDLERQAMAHQALDQNYRQEKEMTFKLQAKIESFQEKLRLQQQESFSLKQQLELIKLNAGNTQGTDNQEKLNSILASLSLDNDRTKANLQEKNISLIEQAARLKEEVKSAELRRSSLEQDLKRLQDEHNSLVKKLSQTEASLQIALKAKEQAEHERTYLKSEVERLQHKYQETHDKSVESQARISELVDRLEKAESTSMLSHQQLASTSANMQGLAKSKTHLDETMQQLQIENAKLEAELKYEKQRADMLNQDLQDSMKVRSSLEALCANLKSSSAHLEDRLGSENGYGDGRLDEELAAKAIYESEAHDHKALYDLEMKSRSKLGLRIADLERNKGEEITRANLAGEKLKNVEMQLEFEKEKNQKLQKDVTTLRVHLKSAKNKMKEVGGLSLSDPQYTEFQKDVVNKETFVSTPREQGYATENIGDIKAELEAKYRRELNRKLSDVNKFLESQSQLRDRLDTSRTDLESNLLFDKRKLEEEINNLRVKYEQAVAQRETKEMEAKRFRELYESEMKWRIRVSDQLQSATEKGSSLQSKLFNERHHLSRITGSIGNLNSSVLSTNGLDYSRVNGYGDELSSKIKAELNRSIAKHLEAAPHDLKKPLLRPESERFSSSLTQSSSDYVEILKRKYFV